MRRALRRVLLVGCALGLGLGGRAAFAQQLPLRCYGVADGLADPAVLSLFQDSQGFLWVGTREGLSRFDGYEFLSLGLAEGLGHPMVNAIAEDREGSLWVATNGGGIAQLEPAGGAPGGGRLFRRFTFGSDPAPNQVNAFLFDGSRTLWAATDGGIYHAELGADGLAAVRLVEPRRRLPIWLQSAHRDELGRLWFGVDGGLLAVAGSRSHRYALPEAVAADSVASFLPRPGGGLLVATDTSVYELEAPQAETASARWSRLPIALTPEQKVYAAVRDRRGSLWLATRRGLVRFAGDRQQVFGTAHGLPDAWIRALLEDRQGNLWIGTLGSGLCKLSGRMIESFTGLEGLPDPWVVRLVEGRDGRIYASSARGGGIVEIAGDRVVPVPGFDRPPFDAVGRRLLQDRAGRWWVGTDEGLYRFPGPRLDAAGGERLSGRLGLPASGVFDHAFALHEDASGGLWVCSLEPNVYRLDPGGGAFALYPELRNYFGVWSDGAGGLWIADYYGFGRWRDGRVRRYPPPEGGPPNTARAFFRDRRGRLWIGFRYLGAAMIDQPGAAEPPLRTYDQASGLGSDTVLAIAEDRYGRIYLATGRGLDVLEPDSGRLLHLTSADGLVGDAVNDVLADREGRIWVATSSGLSRLQPEPPDAPMQAPPVYLTRLQVAGEDLPVAVTGARVLDELVLGPGRRSLTIGYVGLSFAGERALAYEVRLEGASGEWMPAGSERSANFVGLAPGRYLFQVRALTPGGLASREPAELAFRILPPIWRRWWFLAFLAAGLAGALFAVHHLRLQRVVALERIRRQIATDLHDDLGAALSEIAILSEVARRQAPPEAGHRLGRMADLARGMRESMADIVWSVDPRRDHLSDLVQRMRQSAFQLFPGEATHVEFRAPRAAAIKALELPPDRRRHLLLIFKEALNNAARHAGASRVQVEVALEDGRLRLRVEDDGRGFDPATASDGHGLESMRERAAALGGELEVRSAPEGGTRVELRAALRGVPARARRPRPPRPHAA